MAARQKRPPAIELPPSTRALERELTRVRGSLEMALADLKRLERAQDLLDLCEAASVDYSNPAGPIFVHWKEADEIARAIVLWRARPNELQRLAEQDAKRAPEPPAPDP